MYSTAAYAAGSRHGEWVRPWIAGHMGRGQRLYVSVVRIAIIVVPLAIARRSPAPPGSGCEQLLMGA
jgi:hypothetical protein